MRKSHRTYINIFSSILFLIAFVSCTSNTNFSGTGGSVKRDGGDATPIKVEAAPVENKTDDDIGLDKLIQANTQNQALDTRNGINGVVVPTETPKPGTEDPTVPGTGTGSGTGTGTGSVEDIKVINYSGKLVPARRFNNRFFWSITLDGTVRYHKLHDERAEVVSTKSWSYDGSGSGARSFVTEAGLVFIKPQPPRLYFVNQDSTPVNTTLSPVWQPPSSNGDRACPVTYKRNGKRYVGVGWVGSDGIRRFSEFKMADAAPYTIDFSTPSTVVLSGSYLSNRWGAYPWTYNCNIDQQNLIYYSGWHFSYPYALDLKTMTEVQTKDVVKNKDFNSDNLGWMFRQPATAGSEFSYGLTVDFQGNIISAQGGWACAVETLHDFVWCTTHAADYGAPKAALLAVVPHSCFYKDRTCKGFAYYDLAAMGLPWIGPLSSLNDGNVIGHTTSNSTYILKLKDPRDATQGVEAVKVADLPGYPYMYVDFTGSNLYLTDSLNVFDMTLDPKFDSGKVAESITFMWTPYAGKTPSITDIEVKARCFKKTDAAKPEFEVVNNVKGTGEKTVFNVTTCKQKFDSMEIAMKQLNNGSGLMDIENLNIEVIQK